MLTTWISPRFNDLLSVRRRAAGRCAVVFRPRLEPLEDRTVPSTRTWDGGGPTGNWSEGANWAGDVAPVAGDDLIFPAGAAQPTNSNNSPSGTSFRSLSFSGSGYTISGGPLNVLNLGAGGIVNSATSGSNRYNGPIQMDQPSNLAVDVATVGSQASGKAD